MIIKGLHAHQSTLQLLAQQKPVVKATLQRHTSRTLTKRLGAVLDRMEQGHAYSQVELAEHVGLSYRSVRRYIDKLAKLGLVTISGRTSATRIVKL